MTLQEIAQQMKSYATMHPYVGGSKRPFFRELRGGLQLTCYVKVMWFQLLVTRKAVLPSDQELEIVQRAFEIPIAFQKRQYYSNGDTIRGAEWKWPVTSKFQTTLPIAEIEEVTHVQGMDVVP